jgi:SnoaL-like domain
MLGFRRAVESRQFERIGELLADDVVFHSPVTFKPYHGRDAVMAIINIVSTILEDFTYQRQMGTEAGADHALVFDARVGELSIQGCDLLHTNAEGLIDDLTVMFRPLKAVLAFKDQMGPKLAAAMQAAADA